MMWPSMTTAIPSKSSMNQSLFLIAKRQFIHRRTQAKLCTKVKNVLIEFSRIRIRFHRSMNKNASSLFSDKFDALVNDLSSGLPAEIAARRKTNMNLLPIFCSPSGRRHERRSHIQPL